MPHKGVCLINNKYTMNTVMAKRRRQNVLNSSQNMNWISHKSDSVVHAASRDTNSALLNMKFLIKDSLSDVVGEIWSLIEKLRHETSKIVKAIVDSQLFSCPTCSH